MKEFNCLDPDQPILGHYFLEASAGTGKTFALSHIFLRILFETNIDAREILVVTFTRAATRELKQRIRELLELAIFEKPSWLYIDKIDQNHIEKRAREALNVFEELQIFTMHGFCHRMLKNHGFDAGVFLSESAQKDYREIIKREIADFFRSSIIDEGFHWTQVKDVLKLCRGSMEKCLDLLCSVIEKGGDIIVASSWQDYEKKISIPVGFTEEKLVEIASSYKKLLNVNKELHEEFKRQVKSFSTGSRILEMDHPFFLHISDDNLRKKAQKPTSYWIDILESTATIYREARDPKKTLLRMASLMRPRVTAALDRENVFLPDMLLSSMEKALHNEAFFKQISGSFQAAVIDEFQDTDSRQWSIFSQLCLERKVQAFYLVGDPKQSIYQFRGADVGVYLKARSVFPSDQILTLSTNYRSSGGLVDRLNALLGYETTGNWLGKIDYHEVKSAQKNDAIEDGKEAVHFALFSGERGRSLRWPTPDIEEKYLFPFIASEIIQLNRDQQIPLKEMAVLIKDRYQAQRLKFYFDQIHLPAQTRSLEHICESRLFRAIKLFLRFLYCPRDESAFRQLLLSPLIRLDRACLQEDLQAEKFTLYTLRECFEKEGISVCMASLLKTKFRGKTVLEHLATQQSLEDYADFIQVVELVLRKEACGCCAIEDLLAYLDEIEGKNLSECPELRRRGIAEDDQVVIMTTHMSKGLEFEIVFTLGIATRGKEQDRFITHNGCLEVFDEGKHVEYVQSRREEKMRELYVAITRAKKRVYVPVVLEEGIDGHSPIEMLCQKLADPVSIESLQTKLKALKISSEKLSIGSVSNYNRRSQLEEVFAPKAVMLTQQPRRTASFSSLTRGRKKTLEIPPVVEGLPSSAEMGVFFHGVLEKAIDRWLYKESDLLKAFVAREVKRANLSFWEHDIVELVERAFTVNLNDFCLRDLPPSALLTELEFVYGRSVDLKMKGFIDLVVIHGSQIYLVDWKTNYLGESKECYAPENLKTVVFDRAYDVQAEIYSECIKKHLNLIEKRSYEGQCGGAYYIFLRGLQWEGCGVYHFDPSELNGHKIGGDEIDAGIGKGSI